MTSSNAAMPIYASHKRVRALEICDVDLATCTIHFSDPAFTPRQLESTVFARYIPEAGDFFVVYDDGYESFSPRKAFLDGYTRVTTDWGATKHVPREGYFTVTEDDPLPSLPEPEMPKSQIIGIAVGIGIILMLIVIVLVAIQFPPS